MRRKDYRKKQLAYKYMLGEDVSCYSIRLRLVTGLLFRLEELETPACNLHNFKRRNVGPEAVFPDLFVKI